MTVSQALHTVASIRGIENAFLATAEPPLMERAGRAAAALALELLADRPGPVLIVAGPGNNGGDGFVTARILKAAGREVVCVLAAEAGRMPADATAALRAWRDAGGQVVSEFLPGNWALAIDALFGIGLQRAVEGRLADWIDRLSGLSCPVLALDIPSGIDADTGRILGRAVRASHTISFIALKPGLLTLDGPDHSGEIRLADLDLAVDSRSAPGRTLGPDLFAHLLKPRRLNSHKGSWGDVGIMGGAAGMVGAAWLAGRAALLLGAGRVFVGCLDPQSPGLDPVHPELMMRSASEIPTLASVLVVGPGLGQNEAAGLQLRRALQFAGPLLLDADALNLVGSSPTMQEMLAGRSGATVLTPHPAEAGRLLQQLTGEVQHDRIAAAQAIAARYRAHVVLKGCGSIVAQPDGHWAINTTGNPGMASAGVGDVLSGIVASLLAQGWPPAEALACGVHLHGAAGDLLATQGQGPIGLTASELLPAARSCLNAWITGKR